MRWDRWLAATTSIASASLTGLSWTLTSWRVPRARPRTCCGCIAVRTLSALAAGEESAGPVMRSEPAVSERFGPPEVPAGAAGPSGSPAPAFDGRNRRADTHRHGLVGSGPAAASYPYRALHRRRLFPVALFHALLNLSRIAILPAIGSHYITSYQALSTSSSRRSPLRSSLRRAVLAARAPSWIDLALAICSFGASAPIFTGAARCVRTITSPGPYRSLRELSLTRPVGLDTRHPPT